MIRNLVLLCLALTLTAGGCKKQTSVSVPALPATSSAGSLVADTITYDVLITNPDPQDTWTTKCLGRLNRRALIDSLFTAVYEGRAVAYDFETLEKLTPARVQQLESADGFNRDQIGKIQFTEAWYISSTSHSMTKEVLSVVLGSNYYDSDGNLFGHKPVMRIVLR
jgi:hypothetical protein